MICYKIKEGVNFCRPVHARQWVQRVVLINIQDLDVSQTVKNDYSVFFRTKVDLINDSVQVGGKAFEYPEVYAQILGTAESVKENNYLQWKHNVQISFAGFEHFERLNEINRGDYFAALLDYNNKVWIFGFDYGLEPDNYLYQNITMDTLTLRSRALEDTTPLLYLGDANDFWNNFTDISVISPRGDFNKDFNSDFDNEL